MKQFKIRIENPREHWHAIEIWIAADSILEAGNEVVDVLQASLGISVSQVAKLIDITPEEKIIICPAGYTLKSGDKTLHGDGTQCHHRRR